jgi:Ribbon-helix-helix protein, copG family
MTHRTQITLDDEQYKKLQEMSNETGLSMSELIRRAVDRTYVVGAKAAFDESFGAWKGHKLSGAEYVERTRRGLGARLENLDVRAG